MWRHSELEPAELGQKLKQQEIRFAGNAQLKIYGRLTCASGKRMLKNNRVFFLNEDEAIAQGYRPCGHCMRQAYKKWKDATI
ncbi:metal-binding protein [Acinetobacter courvalinii]|uniref:Ada metal-binding domain-containing protein n=1 Tax=Acinetobacter courvalinii TaxID=280147 RepID=UPI0021CD7002|nr:Ada metal-binding domain-containing protein [Acinetobacter courvalinii]MCU4370147.1 metal-binding protein [Acinetobacter courvalinii]MCU4392597.1 metal-binding protein [Acinetobacter courvalinii]MCU4448354.1 metal-binding protein [Acinetobacter courvalinii]